MTTDVKAVDLPVGTIVANNNTAIIRLLEGFGMVWHGTNGKRYNDDDIDGLLFADGFTVVRKGVS